MLVSILTHIRRVTLTHLKKRVSLTQKTMTQLLSQVDSKKLALFQVTQFSSQFIIPSHKTESDWLKFDSVFESIDLEKILSVTPTYFLEFRFVPQSHRYS